MMSRAIESIGLPRNCVLQFSIISFKDIIRLLETNYFDISTKHYINCFKTARFYDKT